MNVPMIDQALAQARALIGQPVERGGVAPPARTKYTDGPRTFSRVPASEWRRLIGEALPRVNLVLTTESEALSNGALAVTFLLTHAACGDARRLTLVEPLTRAPTPALAKQWAHTHAVNAAARTLLWQWDDGDDEDESEEPRETRTQAQVQEDRRHEARNANGRLHDRNERPDDAPVQRTRGRSTKAGRATAELADAMVSAAGVPVSVELGDEEREEEQRQAVVAAKLAAEPTSIPPVKDPDWLDDAPAQPSPAGLEDRLRAELERTAQTQDTDTAPRGSSATGHVPEGERQGGHPAEPIPLTGDGANPPVATPSESVSGGVHSSGGSSEKAHGAGDARPATDASAEQRDQNPQVAGVASGPPVPHAPAGPEGAPPLVSSGPAVEGRAQRAASPAERRLTGGRPTYTDLYVALSSAAWDAWRARAEHGEESTAYRDAKAKADAAREQLRAAATCGECSHAMCDHAPEGCEVDGCSCALSGLDAEAMEEALHDQDPDDDLPTIARPVISVERCAECDQPLVGDACPHCGVDVSEGRDPRRDPQPGDVVDGGHGEAPRMTVVRVEPDDRFGGHTVTYRFDDGEEIAQGLGRWRHRFGATGGRDATCGRVVVRAPEPDGEPSTVEPPTGAEPEDDWGTVEQKPLRGRGLSEPAPKPEGAALEMTYGDGSVATIPVPPAAAHRIEGRIANGDTAAAWKFRAAKWGHRKRRTAKHETERRSDAEAWMCSECCGEIAGGEEYRDGVPRGDNIGGGRLSKRGQPVGKAHEACVSMLAEGRDPRAAAAAGGGA